MIAFAWNHAAAGDASHIADCQLTTGGGLDETGDVALPVAASAAGASPRRRD